MEKQKIEQIVTEELNRYDMELPNYEYDTVTARITERIVKLFAIPDVSLPKGTFCECETPDEYYSSGLKYSVCFNCNKRISQNES